MEPTHIQIRGARVHNLRNVSLDLPRNRLICLTGVSGSGKSSLAFDTLYAEGQRRYVESLSTYARQFIGQLDKPDVDQITGLSPAIAIQQKTGGFNPRSTVGTVTGVLDFLRVLWATVGVQTCPDCGRGVQGMSREQMISRTLTLPAGTAVLVLATVVRQQKGTFQDLFAELLRRGFVRAIVDGEPCELSAPPTLQKNYKHDISLVVDRLTLSPQSRSRLAEALDAALASGDGTVEIRPAEAGAFMPMVFSRTAYCPQHPDLSFQPISVQLMSFNNPQGACPGCECLGTRREFVESLLVPDDSISLAAGCIPVLGEGKGVFRRKVILAAAEQLGIDPECPWRDVPVARRQELLFGSKRDISLEVSLGRGPKYRFSGKLEGVVSHLEARLAGATNWKERDTLDGYRRDMPCRTCQGARLNEQARAICVAGLTLPELCARSVLEAASWFDDLPPKLGPVERQIAEEPLKEIRGRLRFLLDVGLEYLSLSRSAVSLSGGESQRIRLASQIGCGLVGVLYVLDEPSIGLHPRDNQRMIKSLRELADRGNTVVVVEHDEDTMREADYIVDFGPGAGHRGGAVVAEGHWQDITASGSLTADYLTGARQIALREGGRRPVGKPPGSAAKPTKKAASKRKNG